MKSNTKKNIQLTFGLLALFTIFGLIFTFKMSIDDNTTDKAFLSVEIEENRAVTNKGRAEYMFRLLRNPSTNQIPANIRTRELQFADQILGSSAVKAKGVNDFADYTEVGPFDVSGRTRGIAIDRRNSDIIIAGGASGGIWKTIDGGMSWSIVTEPSSTIGITAIIQDPDNGDTWYASTAEFFGSARARDDGGGSIYGTGIYKSIDNGETWVVINSMATGGGFNNQNDSDVNFNSTFDFVSNIAINPVTGTAFLSSNAFGVYRSTDGFENNQLVLGGPNQHVYSDVAVASNGTVIAVASSPFSGITSTSQPGVYISTDDGQTWEDITPAAFPADHDRSVIGVSASDPGIFYIFTDVNGNPDELSLFHFDASDTENIISSDRSNGIPNFGGDVGDLNPQGSYNLVCKVHPANSNTVFIGGTNLFRSTDGFSTIPAASNGVTLPSESDKYWIGGYAKANNISQYSAHHPDQHNLVFDPNNPDRAFSAQDGGISVTNDITANDVTWSTRENGYNVTQFYTVALHPEEGNRFVAGGTQDNGTPFFRYALSGTPENSTDESSGDGSFTYLTDDYVLTSSQNGNMLRQNYSTGGLFNFSYVTPLPHDSDEKLTTLFIHPFTVNPNDRDIVFFPEENYMWRNNNMAGIPRNTANPDGSSEGWTRLPNVTAANQTITALKFSESSPADRLYYAGFADGEAPKIFRLDNASAATDGEIDISLPAFTGDPGTYVHDISVNPANGDEVLVAISNYEVESIWYTNDAGASWTGVGGNLEGANGPSVRTVEIADLGDGDLVYYAGTSTGLYQTQVLDGDNTVWTPESPDLIGNVVIADLDYRSSDGILAIATHGRGMFIGELPLINSTEETQQIAERFVLNQNYPNPFNPTTNIEFSIPQTSSVTLTVYDINGREIAKLFNGENKTQGFHTATFAASGFASGTYLYRLEARPINGGAPFIQTRRMTLIK